MWRVKILGRRNVRRAGAEVAVRIDGAGLMRSMADEIASQDVPTMQGWCEAIRARLFRMSFSVTDDEREELRWADDGGMGA